MRKTIWLYLVLITVVLSGCKKVLLPTLPEGNNPVYYLDGVLGEDSLNYRVGDNSVTINHGVSELNGVLCYYGEIVSVLEDERLRIEFLRQEKPRLDGGTNVFTMDEIPFLVHKKGKVEFDFGGVGNQKKYVMLEDKNGNFVTTNTMEIDEYGFTQVKAIFADYSKSIYNFEIKHGFADNELISTYVVNGGAKRIDLIALEKNLFHVWFIDGKSVGTNHSYQGGISDGIHEVIHKLYDGKGNESFSKGIVRFKGGKQFWDMKVNYLPEFEFEEYNYGKVIVSMYKNDEWYRSDISISNATENMSVKAVEYIPNEEKNQPLLKFDVAFSGVLVNENKTDSLALSNISGTFSVGLK